LTSLVSLDAQAWEKSDVIIYDEFDALEKMFQLSGDSIHIINFWATWCKPCVAELPYFEAYLAENNDKNIKMTLVSLDMVRQVESKLVPFLNEQGIKSDVVLLADNKMNDYIDKVDPSWEGSIPATLIVYPDGRAFYEQEFHSITELTNIINK